MAVKKKKLLLIAGHGEGDPGACSKWGQEADLARELATLVKKAIGTRLNVTMYDQNKNCYYQSKKGNVPDYAAYDYTLEVHFNAKSKKDPDGDGSYTGVGGYYHPNNPGRKVADAIVDAVAALGFKVWLKDTSTGLLNLNNAQRAGAGYYLLETAFVDDGDDMRWYMEHKAAVARAIAQQLITGLGASGEAKEPELEPSDLYRVRITWEDASSQIFAGTLEGAKRICTYGYSVFDKDGRCVYKNEKSGTKAALFLAMAEEEFVNYVGPLYTKDEQEHGILACVSMAQGILESGYGKTDLAQNGNNLHGMKCSLSGNTWPGTTWDGSSRYRKQSPEQDAVGNETLVESDFRSYGCVEESIEDHAAYLLGAAKEKKQRYAGLAGEKDYRKAIQIIKDGGYATDVNYVDKICSIIKKWNLERFNLNSGKEESQADKDIAADQKAYKVKVTADILNIRSGPGTDYLINGTIKDQGTYTIVERKNGWGRLKSGIGWICLKYTDSELQESGADETEAYTVRVTADVLNIRSGPGTKYPVTGQIRDRGTYTIVEEIDGWGRLKSGKGYISLAYVRKVS